MCTAPITIRRSGGLNTWMNSGPRSVSTVRPRSRRCAARTAVQDVRGHRSADHHLARDHQRLVALLEPAQMRRRPLGGARFEQTIEGAALHLPLSLSAELDHRPAMLADLWRWRMDSDTVDGALAATWGRRDPPAGDDPAFSCSPAQSSGRLRAPPRPGEPCHPSEDSFAEGSFPSRSSIILVLLAGCTATRIESAHFGPSAAIERHQAVLRAARERGRGALLSSLHRRLHPAQRARGHARSAGRRGALLLSRPRAGGRSGAAGSVVRRLQRKNLHARPRSGRPPGRDRT